MSSVYGELIGLDNLHYALVTADTTSAYTPGAIAYLAPGGEIQHEAKTDNNIRFYDNAPMFSTVVEGATAVKMTVSGVPMSLAAKLTGKPYDAAHGVLVDTGSASSTPDCALSGRMQLGDGGYRYFQYLKGKFSIGTQTAQTIKDKATEKTVDLTYTALVTIYQGFSRSDGTTGGLKGLFADTTDAAFTSALQTGWFTQVQTTANLGAVTAIALSTSVPANNAMGIAVGSAIVLTFNNTIASDAVLLMKNTDNTIVAGTKVYDTTGKILTFTPTSALTGAAVYNIIIDGVVDIYGQKLAAVVNKFTCA